MNQGDHKMIKVLELQKLAVTNEGGHEGGPVWSIKSVECGDTKFA